MNLRNLMGTVSVATALALSMQANAEVFTYGGEVTEATDSFEVLTPPGTITSGSIDVVNPGVGGTVTDAADISAIEINVGGFCFAFNVTCASGTQVDITSIDGVNIEFNARNAPSGGTLDVTAFSNIFQLDLPVSLDLTNNSFGTAVEGLGVVNGMAMFFNNELDYSGEITNSTGSFEVLTPVGTPIEGTFTITNPGPDGTVTDTNDVTAILVLLGDGFCFTFNSTCPVGPAPVDVQSIDAINLTYDADGQVSGGTLDTTFFSSIFQLALPLSLDLSAGTFISDNALGIVSGDAAFAGDDDGDKLSNARDNCTAVANPDQADADADGIGTACDGDLDNNCTTDFLDLAIFKGLIFTADPLANFDGIGNVDFLDLAILKSLFFQAPGPSGLDNAC